MQRKKAFVTGGSHGIGRGIVSVLSERGYDVAFTYNKHVNDANRVKEAAEQNGVRCFAYPAALDDPDVPERVSDQAISDLGGIDLMVANAGVTRHYSILNVTNDEITQLFNLNYRAYLLCAKTAARHMVRSATKGNIMFITSSRASRAYPEDMLYGGFKAGIERACESMAIDLATYGIRVNCIAPGMTTVHTIDEIPASRFDKGIPLGRVGTPREVGEAVAYLASDSAAYITGIALRIDGGLILPGMPESVADVPSWINPEWTEKQRRKMEEELT